MHVALVALSGFRVREDELRGLGMSLPGLQPRAQAIGQLPALGLLTLAGLNPPHWTCSYHEAARCDGALVEDIGSEKPDLVAISALTASVNEAYRLSAQLRQAGLTTVLGGLHATACPDEAQQYFDAVVVGEGEPVWRKLLLDVESNRLQRCYHANGSFDLAQAPLPRFDVLGDRPRPRFTLQTQRGCPLACDFCARPAFAVLRAVFASEPTRRRQALRCRVWHKNRRFSGCKKMATDETPMKHG